MSVWYLVALSVLLVVLLGAWEELSRRRRAERLAAERARAEQPIGPRLQDPPGYRPVCIPSGILHLHGDSLSGECFSSDREREFVERVSPMLLRTALSQPTVSSAPCEWSVRWAVVLWKEIERRAPKCDGAIRLPEAKS